MPHRYVSADEDSARWAGFPFRDGDIVISARSKVGTTWVQAICAFDPRATYVVVARHPLDAAVSLYHQGHNLNRTRLAELTGSTPTRSRERPPLRNWLAEWIRADVDPRTHLDSLPGHVWHATDAWRRRHEPNVVLVHYADLQYDLASEMRRLADRLDVAISGSEWPALAAAAGFHRMRADAARFAPDAGGVLRDTSAFFRSGVSGSGRDVLDPAELAEYEERMALLAPVDVRVWLNR